MASRPSTPPDRNPVDTCDFRFETNGTACEWGESYHPGGYHPVHLGDVIGGRYRVIRKLGYGEYSTVWLALDQQSHQYVALKIATASLTPDALDREAIIYNSIQQSQRQLVVGPDSIFEVFGPNGRHACFVLEVMGPNLDALLHRHPAFCIGQPWERRFSKQFAKRILKDVLLGVRSLHDAGIVHGDLHPGNILTCIPQIEVDDVSVESLSQTSSDGTLLTRRDGEKDHWAPSYLLKPAPLMKYVSLDHDPMVKITDLGAAFFESNPVPKPFTPVALRAPETIFGLGSGKGNDIWCVGCLVFEFITGHPLFVRLEALEGNEFDETTNDEHLIQMSEVLGRMPDNLFSQWRRGMKYYGSDGKLLITDQESDTSDDEPFLATLEAFDSLEEQLGKCKPDDMVEAEQTVVSALLRWILDYDPQKRPTAQEILAHPWFN